MQQLNVVNKQYAWIIPTSLAMQLCEVYVVATVAREGFGWLVLALGIGSGLGSLSAVWLHSKFIERNEH